MPLISNRYAMERMKVSYEWERHRRFIELLEPRLDEALKDWQQAMDKVASEIDDEIQRDQFIDNYVDDYQDFQQHQVILVNSFFTASWALFEYHLTRLCDLVQRCTGTPFSVKDFGGSFTDVAKDYLKKLGVSFPAGDAPEWPRIKGYQEIRNKIMHQGAIVSSEWGNYEYADSKGIINDNMEWTPRLELTREFCDEAVGDFERFLGKVISAIAKWDERE